MIHRGVHILYKISVVSFRPVNKQPGVAHEEGLTRWLVWKSIIRMEKRFILKKRIEK